MTYETLIEQIEKAYNEGVTQSEAERLAAGSLLVMNDLSCRLIVTESDRRMKKVGLKAIRAAVRLEAAKSGDKKPTESIIDAMVDTNELVSETESGYDAAEVASQAADRQYNIAKESHLYFRSVAKGSLG